MKHTTGRQNAQCLPRAETLALIREAARRAVANAGNVAPLRRTAAGPVTVEIDTLSHRQADRIERFRPVERRGVRTVAIVADDVPTAFAEAWLAVEVADFEAGAWNQ